MKFLRQVLHIARYELAFVLRFPKMLIASLAVTLIPALFTILYLSSVWDPSANSRALPVGLVNLDQDVTYRNDVFNMGRDVVAELKERAQFGFMELDDEATARDQVRRGHLAFALIIPSDFSSNALPGAAPGAGKLTVFTSAGNSYESASLARQFDQELTQQVNEKLNERRWALVLTEASGSQDRLTQLRTGMERLRDGALDLSAGGQTAATATAQLLEGTQKLQLGVDQSTEGFKKLGEAVRQMESQLPPADDLRSLNRGAAALAQGHKDYQTSLIQIRQGQQQLLSGVVGYQSEAASSFFTPARLNEGLDELVAGMTQLDTGLAASLEAHQKLSQGATQVSSGVTSLVFGIRDYRVGMRNLVARLPDEPTLDQLSQGSHEVTKGVERLQRGAEALSAAQKRLALGMELVVNVLPESPLTPLSDNPSGLAHSVDSVLEDEAPVLNHGSGFAPNIIPAALWLGAGIAAFLIHVRLQPRQAQVFHPVAQLMGKVTFPALIVLVQAALVLITVVWVLGIPVVHLDGLSLMLALSALSFMLIVMGLVRAIGDAGKALSMVLLTLQTSASGGLLPVELSGSLYEWISPWLPMTWVVKGIKASMFGAFNHEWGTPLLLICACGALALVVSAYIGRWRYMEASSMRRPAINF